MELKLIHLQYKNKTDPARFDGTKFVLGRCGGTDIAKLTSAHIGARCDATGETQPLFWPSSAKTIKEEEQVGQRESANTGKPVGNFNKRNYILDINRW